MYTLPNWQQSLGVMKSHMGDTIVPLPFLALIELLCVCITCMTLKLMLFLYKIIFPLQKWYMYSMSLGNPLEYIHKQEINNHIDPHHMYMLEISYREYG